MRDAVAGDALDGVSDGMAEVEERAHAALEFVLRDDVALDPDAGRDDVRQDVFGDGAFEHREKAVGPEGRVLDDFGPAAGHFGFGQRLEAGRVADHEHGLMKGAHEVFAALEIDGGFAADARIDHREERRRDLDKGDAAQVKGSGKPGQVSRHAAAQGDDRVGAGEAQGGEMIEKRKEHRGILGGFARLEGPGGRLESGFGKARGDGVAVYRHHVAVAHDDRAASPDEGTREPACVLQEPFADEHLIGPAGSNVDRFHESLLRWMVRARRVMPSGRRRRARRFRRTARASGTAHRRRAHGPGCCGLR